MPSALHCRRLPNASLSGLLLLLTLAVITLPSCAPDADDAVGWYATKKADIDAFDNWLRTELAALPGLPRRDVATAPTSDFARACRAKLDELGAVGARGAYAYNLPPGAIPATGLCSPFGVTGWTRGTPAAGGALERDGRKLGWGVYVVSGDERQEGFQVAWDMKIGDAVVAVSVWLPKP